jgi:hypothetical protein
VLDTPWEGECDQYWHLIIVLVANPALGTHIVLAGRD